MIARPQTNHLNPNIVNFGIGFIFLIIGALLALMISSDNSFYGVLAIIAPIVLGVIIIIFSNPYYGILLYLNFSFISNGLSRYIPENISFILGINFILLLTTLSMVVHIKWDDLKKLSQIVFYIAIIWTIYSVLLVVNPLFGQVDSLIYALKGISFYAVQLIPLVLLYMNTKNEFNTFLKIIIGWSVITTIWAFKQTFLGADLYEQKWLDAGGYITNILNGELRSFSTFSNASQFGSTMAFVSFVCLILSFGSITTIKKYTLLAIAIFTFLGCLISGSSASVYIFIFGFLFFFIFNKHFKTLIFGLAFSLIVFSFLKFTDISNLNYQVLNIASSLDPNDASLMVHSNNQYIVAKYLENKPFSIGIENVNLFGIQNHPGSFLSNLTSEISFASIWNQNGIVGLILHFIGILYVLVIGFMKVYRLKSNDLRYKMIALYGGFIGIIVSSLASSIFDQTPLGPIMFICMVYFTTADKLDIEFLAEEKQSK
jgi:hypothetical protein